MSSLYELNKSINELLEVGFNEQCIDFETGEILFDKAAQFLDELQLERKDKLESIALFIKNLEAEAAAIKQEEENLAARRRAKEKKADNLTEYLKQSMQLFGETKFETSKVAMSFRTSRVVKIENEDLLDKKYLREKTEYSPDKKTIKEAIISGIEVAGATLEEKQNLIIK